MVDRGGCGVLIYVLHMIAVEQLPLDIYANMLCQLPAEMYVVGNSKIRIGGGLKGRGEVGGSADEVRTSATKNSLM